jgi:hypothetical protein
MCSYRLFVLEPSLTVVTLLHIKLEVRSNINMPRVENAGSF